MPPVPPSSAASSAQGSDFFPEVVMRGLRPGATLEQLLEAMAYEAAMHGLASAWGVSTTATLLEHAAQALRERAGKEGLGAPALVNRPPV